MSQEHEDGLIKDTCGYGWTLISAKDLLAAHLNSRLNFISNGEHMLVGDGGNFQKFARWLVTSSCGTEMEGISSQFYAFKQ